jgi:TetR/AcrR family transcriptional repressor of bet genes
MTDTKTKKPRTAPPQARRRQLIEATIDEIAKRGLAGTTISAVTTRAGLSVGLANFHFRSKQALFEETLRFLAEEHREQWQKSVRKPGLSPAVKLQAIVDAHFHSRICNRRKLAVWFAFFGDPAWRAAYRAIMTEIDAERRAVSIALCQKLFDGALQGCQPPESVADRLEALYDGFWLNILMYPGTFSRAGAKAEIRDFLVRTFPDHFPPEGTMQEEKPA